MKLNNSELLTIKKALNDRILYLNELIVKDEKTVINSFLLKEKQECMDLLFKIK